MPKYLSLFTFKGETLKAMSDKPADRPIAVRAGGDGVRLDDPLCLRQADAASIQTVQTGGNDHLRSLDGGD